MKQVSTRQFIGLIFFLVCLTKFLVLPSILTTLSTKDAYLVAIILFLIDLVFAYFIFKVIKSSQQNSFYNLLKLNLGKIGAKLTLILLSVYFFVKILLLITETNSFFNYSFYENLSSFTFIFGLFALLIFISTIKLRAIVRCYEILRVIFVISIATAFIASFVGVNYLYSLPLFNQNATTILNAVVKSSFWFGDFLIFFLFIGKVSISKNFVKKATLSFMLASILVTIFIFNFTNMFEQIANIKSLAITNVLTSAGGTNVLGKADWMIILVWSVMLLFGIGILFYALNSFLKSVFSKLSKYVPYIILLSLSVMLYLVNVNTIVVINFINGNFLYFSLFVQYILPIIILTLFIKKKKRKKLV
jgi:hypothetical protein